MPSRLRLPCSSPRRSTLSTSSPCAGEYNMPRSTAVKAFCPLRAEKVDERCGQVQSEQRSKIRRNVSGRHCRFCCHLFHMSHDFNPPPRTHLASITACENLQLSPGPLALAFNQYPTASSRWVTQTEFQHPPSAAPATATHTGEQSFPGSARSTAHARQRLSIVSPSSAASRGPLLSRALCML